MSRFVLIRRDDEEPVLVPETAIPTEAALHDALTHYPQLIPTADLGLGRTVTVGREAGVAAGYADLVLLDEHGHLVIVEIKKEGNPDTRRVVAQLLDYAAGLWGASLDDFERVVLRPFLPDNDSRTLREFVREELTSDDDASSEDPEAKTDAVLHALEQELATGGLTLVVAAPTIPLGVQRVLEYLNAQGMRLFGLEVSYFKGPAEAFVPRIVVRPSAADRATTSGRSAPPTDLETFLPRLPEAFRAPVQQFLLHATQHGGEVQWRSYGVRVRSTGTKKLLATIDDAHVAVALVPSSTFPTAPFEAARARLQHIAVGAAKRQWFSAALSKLSLDDLELVFDIVLELVRETGRPPATPPP